METELLRPEELKAEVAPVLARASALVIVTPDDYESAGEFCKEIARALRKVGAVCDPVVQATDKAHKDAVALRASFADPLKAAKATVSQKQLAWSAEQERIRQAEQRRLQAEADERARKEREKQEAAARLAREKEDAARRAEEDLRRRAQAETDQKAREAALKEAEKRRAEAEAAAAKAAEREEAAAVVVAPVVQVASVAPKVKGQNTAVVWKARITDPRAATRAVMSWPDWSAYVTLNAAEFNRFALRTKGVAQVEGVEFYQESIMRSRSEER